MASEATQVLLKALEAGSYNAAPSTLVQGAALQIEDLSSTMQVVTYDDSHIKLQKMLKVESCKSTLAQFDRQMSYGIFGGSAQVEGAVGQEEDSQFARVVVPMAYYSHIRRVTVVANMIDTVDGTKAEERAASDAAKKLAGDIEFDLFRGKADFSNAGSFDGSMGAIPALPSILGLDAQIRQSDTIRNAKDLMFEEYGSNISVVQQVGGILTQDAIEDSHVRSGQQHGSADKMILDLLTLSAYNKISFGKERIVLAGSAQDATGSDLGRQWVSGGTVKLESSRFLAGKTGPAEARDGSPLAPSISTGVTASSASIAAGSYIYYVTAVNERGESGKSATATQAVAAGEYVTVTITPNGSGLTARYFNVYRTLAGGTAASAKFIGRVANSGAATTAFIDLGNKRPGFVTGFLVQGDTMGVKELSPYSRLKLAVTDLSVPEAHFRFLTLAVTQPRKNVLLDNLVGSSSFQ
jgi:hypothetical protein